MGERWKSFLLPENVSEINQGPKNSARETEPHKETKLRSVERFLKASNELHKLFGVKSPGTMRFVSQVCMATSVFFSHKQMYPRKKELKLLCKLQRYNYDVYDYATKAQNLQPAIEW